MLFNMIFYNYHEKRRSALFMSMFNPTSPELHVNCPSVALKASGYSQSTSYPVAALWVHKLVKTCLCLMTNVF